MSERTLQNEILKQIAATEARVEQFALELELWLKSNLSIILQEIQDGQNDAASLGALLSALESRGLSAQLNRLGQIYGSELRQSLAQAQLDGTIGLNDLVAIDATTIQAFTRFKVEEVQATVYKYVGSLRPILLSHIILDEPFDINALTTGVSAQAAANIKTEVRTGLMGLNRTINAIQAEEAGIEQFLYIGPDDAKTREFCQGVLGNRTPPIYSKAEIAAMSNGQISDVLSSGGGYNCRHHWRPVTDNVRKRLARDA